MNGSIKSLGYNHGSELWWKEEFKPACGEAAINKKGVVSPKGQRKSSVAAGVDSPGARQKATIYPRFHPGFGTGLSMAKNGRIGSPSVGCHLAVKHHVTSGLI